jgi:hypothetical protein
MRLPSRTSTSSEQADGQSCGQTDRAIWLKGLFKATTSFVIPGLVPGIHGDGTIPIMDCRVKPGNDK